VEADREEAKLESESELLAYDRTNGFCLQQQQQHEGNKTNYPLLAGGSVAK
jgi:hypothetical protein